MEHLFWGSFCFLEARKRKELHPFHTNKAFALNGVINKHTLMPGVTAANRRKEAGREGREGSRDATLESSAGQPQPQYYKEFSAFSSTCQPMTS